MTNNPRKFDAFAPLPKRVDWTNQEKAQIFQRCKGRCQGEDCGWKFTVSCKVEYDHIIPRERGGDNSIENGQILCIVCHKKKTKQDHGGAAKDRSVRTRHIVGSKKKPKGRPMSGTFASGIRKQWDGTVLELGDDGVWRERPRSAAG